MSFGNDHCPFEYIYLLSAAIRNKAFTINIIVLQSYNLLML